MSSTPFASVSFNVVVTPILSPENYNFAINQFDFTTVAPEPTSVTLLGLGLSCLIGYGLRHRLLRRGTQNLN
jgi:hypothetical protein